MTQTTFERGSQWSEATLNDGWGETPPEAIEQLTKLIVTRFEELCADAGDKSIYWQPATSEVIGDVYGQDTDEHGKWERTSNMHPDLDELRQQATSEVWNALIGDNTPMSGRVNAIPPTTKTINITPSEQAILSKALSEHLDQQARATAIDGIDSTPPIERLLDKIEN